MGCRTLKKMTHMSILSFGATISRKTSFDNDFKNSYNHQNDSCDCFLRWLEFGADTKTFKVRYSVFSVCYSSVVGKV